MKKGYFVNNEIYHESNICSSPIIVLTEEPGTSHQLISDYKVKQHLYVPPGSGSIEKNGIIK